MYHIIPQFYETEKEKFQITLDKRENAGKLYFLPFQECFDIITLRSVVTLFQTIPSFNYLEKEGI